MTQSNKKTAEQERYIEERLNEFRTKFDPILRGNRRGELARWLAWHIGWNFKSRQVQISRVFPNPNRRRKTATKKPARPSLEFLISVEHWYETRDFDSRGLPRNDPNGKPWRFDSNHLPIIDPVPWER